MVDTSDWPSLGSEGVTTSKKDSPSNGDPKDKDKKASISKNNAGSAPASSKPTENVTATEPSVTTHLLAEKAKDLTKETVVPVVSAVTADNVTVPATVSVAAVATPSQNEDAQKSKSPVPENIVNHHQQASKEKNVPKSIEDGNKRVSTKPKWAKLDVDTKTTQSLSTASQNRRRSPPRSRRGDDYRDHRDDRSIRRSGSNRGNVPSNRNGPRPTGVGNNGAPTASSNAVNSTSSMKPTRGGSTNAPSTRNATYITRSNRPSYTESKTPGLNGNPIIKPTETTYDAKKSKQPLIGRPIIIEAPPIVTNVFGTYYFNGPAPFTMESIGNIKDSIRKQM